MKTPEPQRGPAGIDESLKRALDFPPEAFERLARCALRELPASRPPVSAGRRWLPLAAALGLCLAVGLYLARLPVRPAPRRPSITNVNGIIIATTPEGGGRLLRSTGAPEPTGITWIVRHGGTK